MSSGNSGRLILAAAILLGAATAARADGIDLAGIRTRVDEALESLPSGAQRTRYVKLAGALAKPDRPGLADDFGKLDRVAKACAGPLAADDLLRAALRAGLEDGALRLVEAESETSIAISSVPSEKARRRGDAAILRGRRFAANARKAIAEERGRDACRYARRAVKTFQAAGTAAARALVVAGRSPATWQVVLHDLPAELLSVSVSPGLPPEVYAVGAGDAQGPLFLRGGPEGFVRIPVPGEGDLWWVAQVPGAGVWAAGTDGRVVRYNPASGSITDVSTGVPTTLYGLWGSGPNDVWVVGGGRLGGTLLHWNGSAWAPGPVAPDAEGDIIYKIAGTRPDELYACGTGGLLLQWDGTLWRSVESGTQSILLTLAIGGPEGATGIAVGEVMSAEIVERSGSGDWEPVAVPEGTRSIAGVFVPPDGDPWACGYFATVLRRVKGRWTPVEGVPFGPQDNVHLHALHVDDEGGVWLVGGDVFRGGNGTLLYHGPRPIGSDAGVVVPQARWTDTVQPLLYGTCAFTACHVPPLQQADLDMETPASAAASLPGVPSTESALLRVTPGSPSRSYLWHKLLGTQADVDGTGVRMPKDSSLTPAQRDAIRAWILEGAPVL